MADPEKKPKLQEEELPSSNTKKKAASLDPEDQSTDELIKKAKEIFGDDNVTEGKNNVIEIKINSPEDLQKLKDFVRDHGGKIKNLSELNAQIAAIEKVFDKEASMRQEEAQTEEKQNTPEKNQSQQVDQTQTAAPQNANANVTAQQIIEALKIQVAALQNQVEQLNNRNPQTVQQAQPQMAQPAQSQVQQQPQQQVQPQPQAMQQPSFTTSSITAQERQVFASSLNTSAPKSVSGGTTFAWKSFVQKQKSPTPHPQSTAQNDIEMQNKGMKLSK